MWHEFKWCFLFLLTAGIISFVIGQFLPKSLFRKGTELWFAARPKEKDGKIYDNIGVRHWKDKVPDMSKVCHRMVPKSVSTQATSEGTTQLIRETCIAELIHEFLIGLGFVCYLKFRSKFSLFLSFLWAVGNLPYIIIQRYNRPRLIRLRERLLWREQQSVAPTPHPDPIHNIERKIS